VVLNLKIELIIERGDIEAVHELFINQKNKELFNERYKLNVRISQIEHKKDDFWHAMMGCLLTSQQKSGPKSAVSQFLEHKPFPLSLELCEKNSTIEYMDKNLTEFGGIRFPTRIAKFADENLKWLNSGGWKNIANEAEKLANLRRYEAKFEDINQERIAANFIRENLKGFGPKQSRNLWQWIGYTRFEIPLDSRVIKWLNSNNIFPMKITSTALSDINYYEIVLNWIQKLCVDADVLPCMLDAAIFSSYDNE